MFYARLRANSFASYWEDEVTGVKENSLVGALGGSLVYKSAYLYGFSIGAGLYTTFAKGSLADDKSYLYKSGKDTLNRYKLLSGEKGNITTFAQAYLEYKHEDTYIRVGRQVYESFLTKSNDTKMIPNSFEGISLLTKILPNTLTKLAYLIKQKLRDHSKFHHLLAYGDDANDPYTQYS